jgi:predicted nucleic acid-binding protein
MMARSRRYPRPPSFASAPLAPARDLALAEAPLDHWLRVGLLRAAAARRGVSVSTPDAHVAPVAIDVGGEVWSADDVFAKLDGKSLVRAFVL